MASDCILCSKATAGGRETTYCPGCLKMVKEVSGEELRDMEDLRDIAAILNISTGDSIQKGIEGILNIAKTIEGGEAIGIS